MSTIQRQSRYWLHRGKYGWKTKRLLLALRLSLSFVPRQGTLWDNVVVIIAVQEYPHRIVWRWFCGWGGFSPSASQRSAAPVKLSTACSIRLLSFSWFCTVKTTSGSAVNPTAILSQYGVQRFVRTLSCYMLLSDIFFFFFFFGSILLWLPVKW